MNDLIVVGSSAARKHLPNFRKGRNVDYDVWCCDRKSTEIDKSERIDQVIVPNEVISAFEDESKSHGFATLNDLLTIKLSHLPYDIFWKKHLNDYLLFKKYGGQLNEKLYKLLQNHWLNVHGNKPYLSLYRSKDSFFDDFVPKEFDHDYLHELISYPNKPLYLKCLKDGEDVMIDKEKFDNLDFESQIKMFREEINVICCERWLIPTKESAKITFLDAYSRSVHKTVTALTKGWASRFICENIELFLKPNRSEVSHLFNLIGVKV